MMNLRQTLSLRAFGLFKIPLLFIVRPVVIELTKDRAEIKIPLNFITKNHLHVMYLGAMVMGADCACGLIAMQTIQNSDQKVALLYKDLKVDFLKRAEADCHFICDEGEKAIRGVKQAIRTQQRVNIPMNITAITPAVSGDEPVARFKMTLTLKAKN